MSVEVGNFSGDFSGFGQPDNFFAQDPRFQTCSEPLTRHISSESSFSSSTPASPMLGTSFSSFYALQASSPGSPLFPALQDMPAASIGSPYSSQSVATSCDGQSPRTLPEEIPSESPKGRDYPVVCLFPGCDTKPFKRRADLDRHYKHKHAPASQKESYFCDYPRCTRRRDPFHRRDHFRDHLREFHKEDIEKRGGVVNEEWLEDCNLSSSWWRCAKCLVRNYIEKSGYECPKCKTTCQAKRKELRMRD
ncbi:Zinc finger, C2H2-like protein [Cordyceps fumosorosea ARSEF 2679]|uniref:Zinc finger, C2H2-like protein n=1 Tax=Cordyceps fumosorosea (strain ARSEF 2679) TaxID=1081104 RepID=A0A167PQ50_CORFA|nr:Zinc finger, C2H2-like protein [Cordyceps fumosorosea ARSEF 2679]OAA56911.1 Zinc finger, C2H2-like protein [Cordyceps fumosorosea ARSEF 2679]